MHHLQEGRIASGVRRHTPVVGERERAVHRLPERLRRSPRHGHPHERVLRVDHQKGPPPAHETRLHHALPAEHRVIAPVGAEHPRHHDAVAVAVGQRRLDTRHEGAAVGCEVEHELVGGLAREHRRTDGRGRDGREARAGGGLPRFTARGPDGQHREEGHRDAVACGCRVGGRRHDGDDTPSVAAGASRGAYGRVVTDGAVKRAALR
jgi:hypothetical protein